MFENGDLLDSLTELDLSNNLIEACLAEIPVSPLSLPALSGAAVPPHTHPLSLPAVPFPQSLSGLGALPLLTDLHLSGNEIDDAALAAGTPALAPTLRRLDLGDNLVMRLSALSALESLPNLRVLVLAGNPVAALPGYRGTVLDIAPELESLDGIPVDAREILAAPGEVDDDGSGNEAGSGGSGGSGDGAAEQRAREFDALSPPPLPPRPAVSAGSAVESNDASGPLFSPSESGLRDGPALAAALAHLVSPETVRSRSGQHRRANLRLPAVAEPNLVILNELRSALASLRRPRRGPCPQADEMRGQSVWVAVDKSDPEINATQRGVDVSWVPLPPHPDSAATSAAAAAAASPASSPARPAPVGLTSPLTTPSPQPAASVASPPPASRVLFAAASLSPTRPLPPLPISGPDLPISSQPGASASPAAMATVAAGSPLKAAAAVVATVVAAPEAPETLPEVGSGSHLPPTPSGAAATLACGAELQSRSPAVTATPAAPPAAEAVLLVTPPPHAPPPGSPPPPAAAAAPATVHLDVAAISAAAAEAAARASAAAAAEAALAAELAVQEAQAALLRERCQSLEADLERVAAERDAALVRAPLGFRPRQTLI